MRSNSSSSLNSPGPLIQNTYSRPPHYRRSREWESYIIITYKTLIWDLEMGGAIGGEAVLGRTVLGGRLYKNQRAYLAIPVSNIKGLIKLKNVLSCFKPSYRSVQISPRFL